MKLIKLNTDHYIIVDHNGVDIYTTQENTIVPHIPLSEVKELLGEVDVEKKAYDYVNKKDFSDDAFRGYKEGYQAAIEDNKGKVYTEEDVLNILYDYDNVDW